MKKLTVLIILFGLIGCKPSEPEVYLFSFFQGNGEDGLHLAASTDGLNWKALNNNESFLAPTAGKDKLMRDPCIIKGGDDKFHMVWTVSWNERGIGYANSTDLIKWSDQKYIPVMDHEPTARNCWAPEIYYDEEKDQYLIYWATTIPGRFPATDTLGGGGYDHRMYYTTTRDFRSFSDTKILYDKGFSVIDATIVKDGKTYVMFLKNETLLPKPEKNIRISTSTDLLGDYSEPTTPITTDWVEGPTVTRVGNDWVVYFDMYTKSKMGGISSKDLKIWTDISENISFPKGTRHGTVFKVKQSVLENIITAKTPKD
ncbi:glycoside hydrolase family 43 protein [Marinoscillum sp. MHG1-6]|uniref:glycoside hydrolase family 43 protein n=1 Tax=Marinoscillum sp. MHG1-6 TaxID=2959627 RepID=UPI0021571754|nr:glycoside hydrolase family 43 protein [Marinoscillum sp. MHG1-6]